MLIFYHIFFHLVFVNHYRVAQPNSLEYLEHRTIPHILIYGLIDVIDISVEDTDWLVISLKN